MALPYLRSALPRARAATLALAALAIGAACVGGAHAPDGPPKGTLALGGESEARPDKGPFAVVFGSPRGATIDPPEISLVFNRPMAPMELAGNEATPPVKLTPEVKGRWQWVGTNALTFVPETRLPRATELTVEVPAGTKSLSGDKLDKPYRLEFSTVRPRVLRLDTGTDQEHLSPDSTFTVWLNQPVDAAELKRAATIDAGAERAPIPFDVKQRDPDNDQVFVLTPTKRLPLDKAIHVKVSDDLRGKEGPLTANEPRTFDMETYGPLQVTDSHCSNSAPRDMCAFDSGIQIELSNAVKLGDLKKVTRIEPKIDLRWSSWMQDDEEGRHFYVYGSFKPGRRYTLSISAAGLKDEYGQSMVADHSRAFDFGDVWPTAAIGLSGTYLEPSVMKEITAYVVNSQDAELALAPLTEDQIFALDAPSYGRSMFGDLLRRPGVVAKKIGPASVVNTTARHSVKLEDVLGKEGRGPVQVGVRYTDRPGTRWARVTESVRVAQVTDLSISAKVSPEGSLVWVTSLSTGAPVAGAKVDIRWPDGKLPAEHTTDKDGFVKIPGSEFTPKSSWEERSLIVAKSGTDWSYRSVSELLDGWRFGAPFDFEPERAFGLVFTDAGIYRPGDTVKLKGIVREPLPKGTRTPAGGAVTIHVDGPDGQTLAEIDRKLSAFGTFDADIPVPATGRLGTYSVWTELEDADAGTNATTSFEVAEYRPAEFKVTAETDRPSYVRGDSISCTARGDYLYGAPMSKAEAHVSLTRGDTAFSPPDLEGFTIHDGPYTWDLPDATTHRDPLHAGGATLDAKGAATVKATLTMPGQRGPEALLCEAQVTDISRQQLAGSTTAIVHPADFYVALRTGDDWFLPENAPVKPEVLAVDPKGTKLAGKSVKIELLRRTWTVAREKTGGGGIHRVSTPVDKAVASCTITTATTPASCPLKPPSAGYYIVRASAEDGRKNPVAASSSVYVLGEGSSGWRDADDNKLGLVTDRKSYSVGQTAKVLIKSPFPTAEAWITVERAGVYTSERRALKGSMPSISIPITEDLRPNAFVSVLLVRGRSKAPPKDPKGADVGAPAFRFGAAELKVDPETKRLAVKLSPDATDKRPGQEITVGVDVKDRQNKPARAEVTLYAVDEGVLSLINYQTPDPIGVLSAPRPLRVGTMETREALAHVYNPYAYLGLDKGKDGGGGAESQLSFRRDFRTSAYFHPTLVTDANGHTEARFKLPESLTTYRLMAVVTAEDDRYGYAQSFVTTSRPLMARPALPRFLRAGDTMDAGVVVTSKGLAKTAVDVELTAEGLVVKGPSKKTVDLEPGQSVEVRFAMDAPRVAPARLRFVAKGGGETDRVEVTRQIAPPLALEAVALYGDTTGQSVEALGDMSAIRDDAGGLSIAVSSTALVGLAAGVEQLIEYPYGCTEQLTSRLVPLLPLRDLAKDYGFPLPKNVDTMVDHAVNKILTHQRADGGFGWWSGSERSEPWLTAYALWGLHHAKKRGVAIPASILDSATEYLQGAMEKLARDPWERAAIPFILDVLAERGQPDHGRMTIWFEDRKTLPLFAQAHLLHAMAISKYDRKSIDTLATEMETALRLDGPVARVVSNHGDEYAVLIDSDTRSSALVLRALVAAKPQHAMASRLVRGLLDDRRGGTWRTTQETAWSLLALDDYRRAQEKEEPHFAARLFLGQAEIARHPFDGRSISQATTTLTAAQVTSASRATLGFSVEGEGRLYYEARLRYARKELPKKPIDRGFFVSKTYRAVKPEELSEALGKAAGSGALSFTGGDLILGEVVVVTPSPRHQVVVDDPLPAGFEAIDARLATTARSLDLDAEDESEGDFPEEDDIAMGRAFLPSGYIREVRDDRVLFFVEHMAAGMYRYRYLARATTHGTFVLPPARAEEMYAPEVFGRTAAASVTVAPK
jgi:uncharacterized protein YfaS (alpha-2-macroglobulin family)